MTEADKAALVEFFEWADINHKKISEAKFMFYPKAESCCATIVQSDHRFNVTTTVGADTIADTLAKLMAAVNATAPKEAQNG